MRITRLLRDTQAASRNRKRIVTTRFVVNPGVIKNYAEEAARRAQYREQVSAIPAIGSTAFGGYVLIQKQYDSSTRTATLTYRKD